MTKMVHTFLGQQRVTELNHMLLAIGHLNAISYFKCSINSELKCGLLGIILTEPTIIFRIFGNVLVFFNKAQKLQKNRKHNLIRREREKSFGTLT